MIRALRRPLWSVHVRPTHRGKVSTAFVVLAVRALTKAAAERQARKRAAILWPDAVEYHVDHISGGHR